MKVPILYAGLAVLLLSFTQPGNECSKKCANKTVCKNEFRTITVSLSFKGDLIQKYHTERAEDGMIINLNPSPDMPHGTYLLLSDAEKQLTNQAGKEFYFVGYRHGFEVVREKYTIGNKDNHVVVLKGDTEIKVKAGC